MANGYLSEIDGEFFNSPQFVNAMNYQKEYNTRQEFLNDGIIGVYDESQNLYKRETQVSYKNATGYITTLVKYSESGVQTTKYYLNTTGMVINRYIDNAINDVLTTLGIKSNYNNEVIDTIKNYVITGGDVVIDNITGGVDAIVNKYGVYTYLNSFINSVRDAFLYYFDKYETPIDCKYGYERKVLPDGYSTIVDWDNTTLSDTVSAFQYEGNYGNYDYEDLHEQLEELAENDNDLKRILNYPNVRIGIRTRAFPDDFRIRICGMNIANGTVVTTTESDNNQHYGVRITHVDWVAYETSQTYYPSTYPVLNKTATGRSDVNISDTLYNYKKSGYYPDNSMIGTSASVSFDSVIDSIGFTGLVKPYETIPNAILPDGSKTLDDNYPDWDSTDDDTRPVTPDADTQIFIGIPDINISYPLPPIINRPIILPEEINAPPTNIVIPHNSDYGLFTIYLPTDTIMGEVTGNLWSPSIVDRITRIFKNNPMDAVISLHEIYLSGENINKIKESTPKKVYFGNVEMSTTASDWTKQRYIELTFGALPVKLEFNDYRDYQRELSIYLPFIGFQQLRTEDFTGKGTTNIELKYVCDVLTGDVIANLYISKDGLTDNKLMYTWSGNMSSVLPLSANDKSRLFSNVGNAIGSVATAFVTKGASLVPSLIGGATNVATGSQSSIQRSGSISGNSGAMNYKSAFLLINNPRPLDVTYNDLSGYTTNLKVRLSSITGYARVSECHVDTLPNASDTEKSMIESILKDGVIF